MTLAEYQDNVFMIEVRVNTTLTKTTFEECFSVQRHGWPRSYAYQTIDATSLYNISPYNTLKQHRQNYMTVPRRSKVNSTLADLYFFSARAFTLFRLFLRATAEVRSNLRGQIFLVIFLFLKRWKWLYAPILMSIYNAKKDDFCLLDSLIGQIDWHHFRPPSLNLKHIL